jgi:riboflavin biosynthesis pyrimidine reductase
MSMAVALHSALRPLEVLHEESGLHDFGIPDELSALYGGLLGFTEPSIFANFVSSLDGVVAIPGEPQSSHLIAGASEADRFVMGLLRACADVVLVGAGTLRASPRSRWTAEAAYPPAGELYAELRRRRGRPPKPTLAVLSGSGAVAREHPGLSERSLVLTSDSGAARLGRSLPSSATIVPIGCTPALEVGEAVRVLRAGGHELILCEGGPTTLGALLGAALVDELFLTISPLLAGRVPQRPRPGLLEDAEFLPTRSIAGRLLSLRRSQSHLFARYALGRSRTADPQSVTFS